MHLPVGLQHNTAQTKTEINDAQGGLRTLDYNVGAVEDLSGLRRHTPYTVSYVIMYDFT
jgi:hypothetical protein